MWQGRAFHERRFILVPVLDSVKHGDG